MPSLVTGGKKKRLRIIDIILMRIFVPCLAFRESICYRSQVLLLDFITRLYANMFLLVDGMLTFDTIDNSFGSRLGFTLGTGVGNSDG